VKILKEMARIFLGKKNIPSDPLTKLVLSGNLKFGNNCQLEGLRISVINPMNGHLNISIGNDCYLTCHIILNSPTSQVTIGDGVFIGPDTTLFCYEKIMFDNDIMVSWGCTFIDTNAHSLNSSERESDVRDWIKGPQYKNWSVVKSSPVHIKSKSWIGFNSIITKGVTLEEGTVVGCGSVITKSTNPYSVYAGNPATFVKRTN
jgi:acetyltransferase-like isoleucine patch superfamily enzyme